MWRTLRGMCGSGRATCAMPWQAERDESLFDTLKRRYALGEITREQFEEVKRTLGVSDTNTPNQHEHH